MDLTLTRRGGSPGVSDLPRGDYDSSSRRLLFKMPPSVQQPCNEKKGARPMSQELESGILTQADGLFYCRTST